MKQRIFTATQIAFGITFATILLLLTAFTHAAYARKQLFLLPNVAIVAFMAALWVVGTALYLHYPKKRPCLCLSSCWRMKLVLPITTIALFLGQCFMMRSIFFETGWDAYNVLTAARTVAYYGENWSQTYFSIYPNNLLITYIYAVILRINNLVGLFPREIDAMSIVVVNCLLNAISCALVYKTARLFTPVKVALFAYVAAVLAFGISAWSVIGYSDSFALFIPILSAYLYAVPTKSARKKLALQLGAIALSTFGYFIKPTCGIMAIALLLLQATRVFDHFSIKKLLRPLAFLLAVLCVIFGTKLLLNVANSKAKLAINEEQALGITHFLMMGQNTDTDGVFSGEDVEFSRSFESKRERTVANLSRSINRIREMGLGGWAKHLAKKLLVTFNDGTFAWGKEGNFYRNFPAQTTGEGSAFLRALYYDTHTNNRYLALGQQATWLTILAFSFMSVFVYNTFSHKHTLCVLWMTALGFVAYELLFEVRARYIYVFVPLFCVLAAIGFFNSLRMMKIATARMAKKKQTDKKPSV